MIRARQYYRRRMVEDMLLTELRKLAKVDEEFEGIRFSQDLRGLAG